MLVNTVIIKLHQNMFFIDIIGLNIRACRSCVIIVVINLQDGIVFGFIFSLNMRASCIRANTVIIKLH